MIDMEHLKADRAAGTEGPWLCDDYGVDFDGARFGEVAYVLSKDADAFDATSANARRIARLPDLEAAFIEAVEVLGGVMGHVDTPIGRRRLVINSDQPEWLEDARAFLAKHTGASA